MKPLALITGAAGGMGRACAERFAASHDLLLTDRDAAQLADTSAALRERTGVEPEAVLCDLAKSETIKGLVDAANRHEALGALIHTAGVSPMMCGWREVMDIDLVGSARLLDAALPLAQPGTVVVCIASIAAELAPLPPELELLLDDPLAPDLLERIVELNAGEPNSGIAYAWAKRGVVRMCERLAGAWGKRGARIVSVSPGLIDTAMGRLEQEENPAKEIFLSRTPVQRQPAPGASKLPGRVNDIASAVAFLCSDEASFISGCDLRVDGGLVGALLRG